MWYVYDMFENENFCKIEADLELSYKIFPPSAFSLNGDGFNDEWEIEKIGLYPEVEIVVLNRLGKKVYESEKGYGNPRDGSAFGRVLPVDSYFYIIKKHDKLVKKGVVTIIK